MKKFSHIVKFMLVFVFIVSCIAVVGCKKDDNKDSAPNETYYTVSFNVDGGTQVKAQTVKDGEKVTKPTSPEKIGFTFGGWYYLGEEWDFNYPVNENFQLTARWYDNSVTYRVTTGVESAIGNRGTAQIQGKANDTARFTEGTMVTLVATPNEGYAFSGWVDYNTGEVVSESQNYTFRILEDVVVEAKFIYVVSGLDNKNNAALWKALDNLNADLGKFSICYLANPKPLGDDITVSDVFVGDSMAYDVEFDRQAGLMSIYTEVYQAGVKIEEITYWAKYTDGVIEYYTQESGENYIVAAYEVPYSIESMVIYYFTSDMNEMPAEEREQTLLAIYTLMKDSLVYNNGEYTFEVKVGELLKPIQEFITENSSSTFNKYLYDNLSIIMGDLEGSMGNGNEGQLVDDLLNKMTIAEMLEMTIAELGATMSDIDAIVEDLILNMAEELAKDGLTIDTATYINDYQEMKSKTIKQMINDLNDNVAGGTVSDLPENASVANAVLYAILNNYKVGDIVAIIVRSVDLDGTKWDVTDSQTDISSQTVSGNMTIENDVITSMGIEERVSNSDRETAFFFNYSVGERLSLPPVDQPQEMANM